jgi:SAM-dependent methyltransferase
VPWEVFEHAAATYEDWYTTPGGRRVDQAERGLLSALLAAFPGASSILEIGCGTGHFAGWLAARSWRAIGLDRAPAMLGEARRRHPALTVVGGDAHRLPFGAGSIDLTLFVTTLEFLEDPVGALAEAVRVSRRGLVVIALNRWSLGALWRRLGPGRRRPLLGQARDVTVPKLGACVRQAAGARLASLRWTSTLFPDGLWSIRARIPLGAVVGMAALLTTPRGRSTRG